MATNIPHIRCQPPSVDFIDNELAEHHNFFKNPPAQYNSTLKKYVPVTMVDPEPECRLSTDGGAGPILPSRPACQAVSVMIFWDSIFMDAMKRFKQEHKFVTGRDDSGYNIRNEVKWIDVYAQLQRAREQYDDTKKGFWGRMKKWNRQAADNSHLASQVVKLLPDIDYVSPVRAVVEVCLDVGQTCGLIQSKRMPG